MHKASKEVICEEAEFYENSDVDITAYYKYSNVYINSQHLP